MLNVRDLERRWYNYNIKRFYPYIFSALALLVLLIGTSIYFSYDTHESNVSVPAEQTISATATPHLHVNYPSATSSHESLPQESVQLPEKTLNKPIVNTTAPIIVQESPQGKKEHPVYQTQKLQPSYSFLQNINVSPVKTEVSKPLKQSINTNITPAIEEHAKVSLQNVQSKPSSQNKSNSVEENTAKIPNGIKIDRSKTQHEIQDITRRFETSKNPALGLYLARYHYKMQNFKKSYNYALSTNNIDPNIEEGWLIFASSQVKLGQTDDALKTLTAYIKSTDSMNAKDLLHKIRTGEFR